MTCRDMGGMCDEAVTAGSAEEMIGKGMAHLEVAHPEMAATIKSLPKDDPMLVEWSEKFMKDYAAAPEVQ